MKRVLLSVLAVGLLAGQASAGLVPVDNNFLMDLDTFTVTVGTGGSFVGPQNAYPSWSRQDGDIIWEGALNNTNNTVLIHANDDAGLSGLYDGFQMGFYNDDDDEWDVRLYVKTTADGTLYSGWTAIPGTLPLTNPSAYAFLSIGTSFTMDTLGDIGFELRAPYDDKFHISAVPVPGAILLGFLGLGVAAGKLRRFA